MVGHNGDIMDTYYDPLRSFVQEIKTRLEADLGDWVLDKTIGASLSDFVGEPNIKSTAEAIRVRIISALTKHGFLNSKDINILYSPIDIDKIMFKISIKVAPTARNNGSETLNIVTLYSYSENNVYVDFG